MIGDKEFLRIVDLLTYRLHRINVSPHIFGRAWPSLYYSRASKVFRKLVLHKCAAAFPRGAIALSPSRLTSLGPNPVLQVCVVGGGFRDRGERGGLVGRTAASIGRR